MNAKVSVIVPVYGTEQYLRKCLDSLVEQTLQEIEIIVVNDGSPDNSQQIIEEYEEKYTNVHGFQKENGGLSDARNYGIKQATGEFIAFVDSDDYVEKTMCQEMYEKATRESLDIVVCDTFMEYPSHSYVLRADLEYSDDPVKAYIITYPNAPARLIKNHLLKERSFKRGIWYEDLDLMPTLAVYTSKIGFVHQAFYHYLQREESIMNRTDFHPKYEDIFVALQDVSNVFEENELYEKYYAELEYLYITHLQRSAILRFIGLNGATACLRRVHQTMKDKFPNWLRNKYLKKSSWKYRMICWLGYLKQYRLISLMKKLV